MSILNGESSRTNQWHIYTFDAKQRFYVMVLQPRIKISSGEGCLRKSGGTISERGQDYFMFIGC